MAHVFDQVSDECSKVISERLGNEQLANDEVKVPNNPVITNFMFKIQNYIVCESCGHTSKTSEESTSLPIDFAVTDSRHEETPLHRIVSIQTMLDDCLRNEKVEHRCDSCGSNSAEIKHKFQKIPRCLVMYLKRYTFEGVKRTDNVEIPLYVTLKGHCTDTMESYEQVPLSTTKIDLLSVDSSIEREDLLTPQKSQSNDSERVTSPTDENDDSQNLCTPLNVSKIDSTCRTSLETLQRNHRRSSSNVPRRLWSSSNSNDIPGDLRNESVRTAAASERRCRSSETRSGSLTPLKQPDTLAPYKSANLSKLLATESCVRDVESPQLPEIILPPSDESADSPMSVDDITPPLSSTKKSAQRSAPRSPSSSPHVVVPSLERQHLNSTNIDASRRCSPPYATPKRVRKGPFTDEELAQMSESEQMKAALELSIRTAESGEVGVIAKDCEQTLTEADEAEWRLATEMAVAEDENMNKITEGVDIEESARLAQEPAATPQDVPLKNDAMKTPKSDHLDTSAQSAVLVYEHRGLRSIKSKAITNAWRAKACKFLRVKMADEIVYPAESEEVEMSLRDRPARCGTVAGDGNCLFRALAFAITGGSDRQHAAIRQCITSFELGNEDRFRVLVEKDAKTWEDHVDALISDGSWGGSSELTAIATMLRIEVWTFLDGRWVCYAPRFQKGAERDEIVDIPINEYQLGSRPAIYLLNEHCHYSPVIELSNKRFLADQALERRLKINADSGELKPSYRLVSVVSHYGSSSYSGHYVCDVWNQKQSEWLHCDDSSVSEISEKNVRIGRTTTGYLFFYMARDVLDEEAV
ncbi:unnamed protein product [Anisakis simplex]|uniref:USP domain-containing protein n=1 Tax=Anisakis simplex TaxID=6269 RepID=A0A0M3K5U7_ANISI|nr:unnamed protein product [Anisakis simplex]